MRFTSRGYEVPGLAADAVVLNGDRVLLVQRGNEPFAGSWALPGGFVEPGETTEDACLRELREETGLHAAILGLLGVFSHPERDPRGHVVSVTYVCTPKDPAACPVAAGDAAAVAWFELADLPEVAFDHGQILAEAAKWVESRQ